MGPLLKANIGSAIRWMLVIAGATGLAPDDLDTIVQGLEMVINGAMLAVPLLWSWYQKWRAHQRIKTAEMQAELAMRRG